ncbi:hypothetical protein AVEN_92832-1 [Araneus ventricosus]|uniref:C-factor n=1 Tax=Araneus ventricosus TaxID=182803 RepID=A0A4Y2IVM0_ARAVE|nr:hypothetical protein AVEN_92832-1 [Araneus ventricosus]
MIRRGGQHDLVHLKWPPRSPDLNPCDFHTLRYIKERAALNMAMRVAATNAKDKGILVTMMCPGWVKTDMGGRDRGVLEPEESIAAVINTLSTLDETHHGVFMDREGIPYPFQENPAGQSANSFLMV